MQKNETIAKALALLEHIEIYRLVEQRKRKGSGKRISLDALLKKHRITA
jgi:hypothetical protein